MSFLWMGNNRATTKHYKYDMPSPMCGFLLHRCVPSPCIEETYPSTSCPGGEKKGCRGSMTVEAAVVVPLLILFILHMGSCMEMLRLHGRLEYALWQTGRELTLFGTVQGAEEIPELAVSYLYVNGRVQQLLGRNYLDTSPLAHGSRELTYLASEYLEEDECVSIVVTYQVCPQITCFPFPYFRMCSRYYGRAWTGYAVGDNGREKVYVYVTEDGEVWHSRADCSYLKPSVFETQPEKVWTLRNVDGERYRPCSRCEDQPVGDLVYLTREGNRIHTVRDCPALLRRIHAVVWQEDMPCRPCSRCGGQD